MKQNDMTKPFDVIVIGGGATGAGIARDCARRGIRVLLIERFDISTGATGRNHGLLHSGARYAVTDQESAEECIKENRILRRIASHCVEETDGLFLSLPEDDIQYQAKFVDACSKWFRSMKSCHPEPEYRHPQACGTGSKQYYSPDARKSAGHL